MTKFVIDHACGHQQIHEIVRGNPGMRAWIAKRRAAQVCSDCSRTAWQAETDSTNAYYTELAAEQRLPEIAGTDRQIPWAVGLRGELLDAVAEAMPQIHALCRQYGRPFTEGATVLIRDLIVQHTDAQWWIENRKQLPKLLRESHPQALKNAGDVGVTATQLLLYLESVR